MSNPKYGNTTEEMNRGASTLVTPTHPREGYGRHPRKFSSVDAKEKKADGHPRKPGQAQYRNTDTHWGVEAQEESRAWRGALRCVGFAESEARGGQGRRLVCEYVSKEEEGWRWEWMEGNEGCRAREHVDLVADGGVVELAHSMFGSICSFMQRPECESR
ncbi:hypothetical protein B0H14DRAFT_3147588 [Mycena olivaceomarginata]|nr:hypothetical protein B0H14DRAFT_3147588 [Mycena olivaceomarginata]